MNTRREVVPDRRTRCDNAAGTGVANDDKVIEEMIMGLNCNSRIAGTSFPGRGGHQRESAG